MREEKNHKLYVAIFNCSPENDVLGCVCWFFIQTLFANMLNSTCSCRKYVILHSNPSAQAIHFLPISNLT